MCEDVKRDAKDVSLLDDQVRCVDPAVLSLQEQVGVAAEATLLIAHHGTVAYISLFAREGAALLSVGKAPLKDAHVLLWASHVQTFFLTVDRVASELLPMMLLSLCRAGASFDLGCPAYTAMHNDLHGDS